MSSRRDLKRLIKIIVIILAVAVFGGYGFFRATNLIEGPELTVSSPSAGDVLKQSLVLIEGEAHDISFLTLNGNKIFTDENGVFREKLLLSYGYNIITVEAVDRFDRTVTKDLKLIYK